MLSAIPSLRAWLFSSSPRGPSPTSAKPPVRQHAHDLRPGGEQDIDAFLLDQAPDGDDGWAGKGKLFGGGLVRERIGQKGEFLLGNEGLKRVERALAVRGHHIGPGIDDVAEPLDPGAMPLEARIVPLGDHGVRGKPARGEHGENIGLGEEGENGVGLDLADGAPEPDRAPALPDHGEDGTGRLETEGQHARMQIGFDVSPEQAGRLLRLAALLLHRREFARARRRKNRCRTPRTPPASARSNETRCGDRRQ